jgi:hypothetical protein
VQEEKLSFFDFLTLEDGTDTLPETQVKDYHSTLRNIPEECRSDQHSGGSLISVSLLIRDISQFTYP